MQDRKTGQRDLTQRAAFQLGADGRLIQNATPCPMRTSALMAFRLPISVTARKSRTVRLCSRRRRSRSPACRSRAHG